ncbi:MAG TPA: helix-turn-helix domain-containing protein [Holophagaceae bacterium]
MELERQAYRYAEAAKVLGKSPRTMRRWADRGILPVRRVTQRTVFVDREAVENLMRAPLPWDEEDAREIWPPRRS